MIRSAWNRIEERLAATPDVGDELRPGASPEAIRATGEALGMELPDELVESYLVHDGQASGVAFLLGPYRLWSLEEMLANQRKWVSVCGPTTRLGFGDNGGSSTLLVETAGARRGAILELFEDGEARLASGLGAFLEEIAGQLERGELVWSPTIGGFCTPEDLQDAERWSRRWEELRSGPTADDLRRQPPGSEVELMGMRVGRTEGLLCRLATSAGVVRLSGSLRGTGYGETLRVRVRIGRRRLLGLLPPVHEIVSWERVGPPT